MALTLWAILPCMRRTACFLLFLLPGIFAYSQDYCGGCCIGCAIGGQVTGDIGISCLPLLIPDYHFMLDKTGIYHGMGFKLALGFTYLDANFMPHEGNYLGSELTRVFVHGGSSDVLAGFNSMRLELLGELIFTNLSPGIFYGGTMRFYMPAGRNISFHVESGMLFSSESVFPHAGAGIGLYLDYIYNKSGTEGDEIKCIFCIVLEERILFDGMGYMINDAGLDIKMWIVY